MYDAPSSPILDTRAGLSVRPDVLWIPIAARVEGAGSVEAVAALQGLASNISSELASLHAGATLQPGRLALAAEATEKASTKGDSTQLEGRVVLPLDLDADYWQRARLAASAHELLREHARVAAKATPRIQLAWRTGTPRLVDADALYPVLAAVWKSRVAMLDDAAEHVGWNAPVQIEQTAVSLEEVKLTLVCTQQP